MIFPLPGELVPLHIFEPRYQQLLEEAEQRDISFGILFNHPDNDEKLGAMVKLESIIKRHPGGESDIIVKCTDLFTLATLQTNYTDKLYPGGEVSRWNVDTTVPANPKLQAEFASYLKILFITAHEPSPSVYHIANELNLDLMDRLRFAKGDDEKKEAFLFSRLRYQKHLAMEVEKSKDVFHLN